VRHPRRKFVCYRDGARTPDEVMESIDANLATMVGGLGEVRERLGALTAEHGEALARIKILDETVKTQDEKIAEIEANHNKVRLNTGLGTFGETDALLNAMPDSLKKWIPRVAALQPGKILGLPGGDGNVFMRTPAMARIAQADPVKYVAAGGWFQLRIKAFCAIQQGNPEKAQAYNAAALELAEKLGGADPQAKAALQEDTDAEGGFLVPTVTEAMIGVLLKEAAVVRRAGPTIIQMTTKTHTLPTGSDFTGGWVTEEGTIADAAPASPFGSGNLVAKKRAGIVTASLELLQDNIVALMDFIMSRLVEDNGRAEDAQALEGDGTVFTGLFSASGVNSVAGGGAVADPDLFLDMIYKGEHASTIESGVVFTHPWPIRDLLKATKTENPVFRFLFQGTTDARVDRIAGVDLFKTSVISRLRGGSSDESTMYFGDPRWIVIGDRMATEFVVNPWGDTSFAAAQVKLRMIRREGILIWVPEYFTKYTAILTT
jgi:HK97 family phage major capsid protein